MAVDKVHCKPDFHITTRDLYSQLQSECHQQFTEATKKLDEQKSQNKPGGEEVLLKYEFEKRKFKQMADHYGSMQQMTDIDDKQRQLERRNPALVVSQIQYEDFQITNFQREMEQARMSQIDKAVENKIQYNSEMKIVDVLNFLDSEEETMTLSKEQIKNMTDALTMLSVHQDDIYCLVDKLTADEQLEAVDIKFVQQEMAFFILNAEVKDEHRKLLANMDHPMILDIVKSKVDPNFQVHTLMSKVQRLETHSKEL